MPIKKLLKYLKNTEVNETLAVGIVIIVIAIPSLIFLDGEGVFDKTVDDIGTKIVLEGKIHQRMTYGRIMLKNIDPNAKYKYFIAEPTPDDVVVNEGLRYSPSTRYLKDTDTIKVTGIIGNVDCVEGKDEYLGCIPWIYAKIENNDRVTAEGIMEIIKTLETERPRGIQSDDKIYNNPYIRHIRIALTGYLDGTNNGVEVPSLSLDAGENTGCGLENFDKSYYKSKFLIYSAKNNDYGGVVANIVFVDKPDKIFWTWVYNIGGDNKTEAEYTLRGFCENNPLDEDKEVFAEIIKKMIKSPEFIISCPNSNCLI